MQQRAGNSLEFIESVKIDLFPDEVYVFTPKGRIMELPKGSTAVDFAYAVHTDVGNSCIACRINRRLAPLSEPLQSGSTVEIVSAPGARPNPAWLSFVVSGKARTHIRHALKSQRRSESVSLGERLLNKVLAGFDSHLDKLPAERLQAALLEYQHEVLDDLLENIGLGNRMAFVVARRLLTDSAEQLPSQQGPLAIRGTEGLVLNYAKCCTPIPGDPIIGHLSAGKGMVVHLDTCKNISDVRHNPEKCIQLSWAKDVSGEFNVELRVELEHQRGLIALLASSVNAADGNIEKISMDERDGRISVVQLVVSVHDRVHLARVIKKLRALKGVSRITRVRG
jgi:guanosine-3',5'-bis(diphosphate) 3'-pyrophosphohydrolase